jgi:hypothetical protein
MTAVCAIDILTFAPMIAHTNVRFLGSSGCVRPDDSGRLVRLIDNISRTTECLRPDGQLLSKLLTDAHSRSVRGLGRFHPHQDDTQTCAA